MDGHRDVVAKSMVVEDIDTEEQHNVDQPPAYGYLVRRQEEWRPGAVELCYVTCHGHEEELHKREKDPFDKISWLISRELTWHTHQQMAQSYTYVSLLLTTVWGKEYVLDDFLKSVYLQRLC